MTRTNKKCDQAAAVSAGDISFRKDGIHIADSEGNLTRIAAPIVVTAFATSNPNTPRESAFTVIEFVDRRDKWKKEIVPPSVLTAQSEQFIKLMSDHGYVWPPDRRTRTHIIAALSIVKPDRDIRVTSVPGWCGKSFVLPDESYGPSGADRISLLIVRHPTVRLGSFRRLRTLEDWKKHVARKCVHSTRARLAMATTFAAPNLRALGLNSFGFNFSGTTSGGKTLLLRLAASGAGLNLGKGPGTWDGTPTAFEQRAMGHRDGIMPLDDISHLEGDAKKVSKLVTFRLADAMEKLIANSANDSETGQSSGQSDQSMLAEFNRRMDGATFVRLERSRRKKKVLATRLTAADGVIRPTKPRRCEYLLFAQTMKAWYPDVSARQRLTKLLRSHRILKGGRRADTNTRQVLITELGAKVPCYGLVRKRLKGSVGNV